jgi:hypothetical protein
MSLIDLWLFLFGNAFLSHFSIRIAFIWITFCKLFFSMKYTTTFDKRDWKMQLVIFEVKKEVSRNQDVNEVVIFASNMVLIWSFNKITLLRFELFLFIFSLFTVPSAQVIEGFGLLNFKTKTFRVFASAGITSVTDPDDWIQGKQILAFITVVPFMPLLIV